MKLTPRFFLRTSALFVGIATILFSWSCIQRPMKVADPAPDVISDFSALQGATRDVDLLFIIDNSLSMAEEQTLLKAQFTELMRVLKEISGGLPNVHIGVTSTDLGTLPYNIPSCETPGGDNGKLMKGSCANPVGQTWIVDIEPAGCTIERNDSNNESLCTATDCTATNCEPAAFTVDGISKEPAGLTFIAADANQCPRCRNYVGEELEDVFACTADLGVHGCGFEQQLEGMYKTFTGNNSENVGFFREDSYWAIFFITDEDDCSAKNSEIFNPAGGIADTLGPLTSFRCTEFGVKCEQDWQRTMPSGTATYSSCASRATDDPRSMLYPVSKYVNYLTQVKDSEMIIAGAIAGPFEGNLTVGVDENHNPKLSFVCGEAVSGVRIKEFVNAFTPDPEDMLWAYTSVCSNDYTPALQGLGEKIKSLVEVQCITTPLNGCPDPAFANGFEKITNLPDAEAAVCVPACAVMDVLPSGVNDVIEQCSPDYLDGHPPKRDPGMPVDKCYHVRYNEKCDIGDDHAPSRGAEIIIARKTNPEPGTRSKITCQGFALTEKLCSDGVDNDQDGDIDDNDINCTSK
jgi:hypothetical protein